MLVCRTSLWQAQGSSILMPSGGGKGQSEFLSGIQLFLFYFSVQSLVRIYFQNLICSEWPPARLHCPLY